MPGLDVATLSNELRPTGAWAAALLHALARDEVAGRRPQRLTEPRLDTWRRFHGRLDTTDLPRRLYDETLSGSRGFWVLVVPGVIHNRQPRFNEGAPMWHLEGATLPLLNLLPGTLT
jgi:hypothetical protein